MGEVSNGIIHNQRATYNANFPDNTFKWLNLHREISIISPSQKELGADF